MSRPAAASLQNLLLEAASLQSSAASSLEMVVMLLRLGRPRHFQDFEAFLVWRQAAATAVCQCLSLGAAGGILGPCRETMRTFICVSDCINELREP